MISAAEIRTKMRISHSGLDTDIQDNIDAALLDMGRVGVDTTVDDKLTDKAIELYCKAEFDYLGKGAEFKKNYEGLRDALSVAEGYRHERSDDQIP